MSEIKLNLLDSHTLLTATVHGSVGDALVAALSAEPETIDELETALKRFQKCDSIPASSLRRQPRGPIDDRPWDAGIMVIDLAARIVANESAYSAPSHSGRVDYHNGKHSTGFPLSYVLSDDWVFARSIENYQVRCDHRIKQRATIPSLDSRSILYGKALLEFIVENVQLLDTTTKRRRKQHREAVIDIHRRWLMTLRDDLNGQSVREILFAKRELIDFDLESRMLQWSFFLEEPLSLSRESHGFRFAGYGTHEWVMYYKLVRFLIWEAVELRLELAKHGRHLLSESCCRPSSVIGPLNQCPTNFSLSSLPEGDSSQYVDTERGATSSKVDSTPDPNHSQVEDTALSDRTRPRVPTDPEVEPYNQNSVEVEDAKDWLRPQDPCRIIRDKAILAFKNKSEPTHAELIAYLAEQRSHWLSTPNRDLDDYIPAEVIDNERRRRPEAMTGRSMVVDEDCYCCKMMGDESEAGLGIYFCHFDGCNMEDEFAFSACATLEEWKAEQQRYEEWSRKSDRERKEAGTFMDLDDCEIPF